MIDSFRKTLVVTVTLTAVFVASGMLSSMSSSVLDPQRPWLSLILLALNTLPLLLLSRNPLIVVVLLCAAYPLWLITEHPAHLFQSLPGLASLYALGAWNRPLWIRAIGLVAPVWMMFAVLTGWWVGVGVGEIAYIAVMFALVWVLGAVVAERRSYAIQLEEKTAALQAAQQELADRAVADERSRIARELHDVIAHGMSIITVRAGVGAHLAETDPSEAGEALRVIESTGRESLSEMRRMLALLRDPDPLAPRPEPQPGLADLPSLITHVEAAGGVVSVTTTGTVQPLPTGLDLAAYRVVQEALTNVVKHSAGARATITITYRPDSLELDIYNPGPVKDSDPGHGIRGMAERVALYDGQLNAGPDADGFRVHAHFPLDSAKVDT